MAKLAMQWTRNPEADIASGGGFDYEAERWIPSLAWVNQFGELDWFAEGVTPPASIDVCDSVIAELRGSKGATQH